jgi:hypothetical protein
MEWTDLDRKSPEFRWTVKTPMSGNIDYTNIEFTDRLGKTWPFHTQCDLVS